MNPLYKSIKEQRRNISTWSPGLWEEAANNPLCCDTQDARGRVSITARGYHYEPSKAYMKHIAKFKKGNLHGNLFGKKF